MTARPKDLFIAVDPGRGKCGLAVLQGAQVLLRALVPTAEIAVTCYFLLRQYPGAPIVVGDLTASQQVREAIKALCPEAVLHTVPEAHTSEQARQRYWEENPPRGWWRWLPRGLLVPPRPVDDYAAVLLGERWLADGAQAATPETTQSGSDASQRGDE